MRQRRRSDRRYDNALAGLARAPFAATGEPETMVDGRKQGLLVRACIARLSEIHQEVFVLFELEEVSGADIAVILDIELNTVWSRLRLARVAFRAEWNHLNGASK